ncbi:RWD domain-containing protein 3 [Phytophthora cinnamomi]|uniref:RWD domain-containing protein 3 n=1 Tax=Phytophthora cinnamomi TaxID=4785 RepID=UPI00355A6DCF|nr:RWD domain-containing protein 3 [Phytophthora cinnamomi]
MVSNKEMSAYFYQSLGDSMFRCKLCGTDRKQLPATGYTNLMSHLAGKHDDFRSQFAAAHGSGKRPLQDYGFVSEETTHRYQ